MVLSPHVFLLGLLFADRAFNRVDGEEVLVLANQLPGLQIRDECNELRLQLDPAMDDVPVFRISEWTSSNQYSSGVSHNIVIQITYPTIVSLRLVSRGTLS